MFQISFAGNRGRYPSPDLKKLWDAGKLDNVKQGFYGGELTSENITREHLELYKDGGSSSQENIVLATLENNEKRGCGDILNYYDQDAAEKYLKQFENVELPTFSGNKYIQAIKRTLMKLGIIHLK